MSLRSSAWLPATDVPSEDFNDQDITTPALDFFLVIQSLEEEKIWKGGRISLERGRRAGQGAFAFAVICEPNQGQLVAVKRSLKLHGALWVYQRQEFAQHFEELCRELCILTHASLRSHENIINLEAIFEEEISGVPSLSLVLEYGDGGTLDNFLRGNPIQDEELVVDCIFQLASGFEALHSLEIGHGDVKMANVLVVSKHGNQVYKICDFGHAAISSKIGNGNVRSPRGTAIYNAPEIRDLNESSSSFTISDVLLTDLYSFGLLVWEILAQGEVYYKTIEARHQVTPTSTNIHEFLRTVPQSSLLQYASCTLDARNLSQSFKDRIRLVIQGTLQYLPKDRMAMEAITRILGRNSNLEYPPHDPDMRSELHTPLATRHGQDIGNRMGNSSSAVLGWTGERPLLDLFNAASCQQTFKRFASSSIRKAIQEEMISELKKLSGNCILPKTIRAFAALSVGQCLMMGFDNDYNTNDIVEWFGTAALLGSVDAIHRFPRICAALCPDAPILSEFERIEPGIRESNPSYLTSSIKRYKLSNWIVKSPEAISQDQQWGMISYTTVCDSSSSQEEFNLLWTALDGFDSYLELNLEQDPSKYFGVVSSYGFTPVHCACIGGHLSTLRLLLGIGFSAVTPTIHGITPLHLCMFFEENDMEAAVQVLLEYGACPRETASGVYLLEYDLVLSGSPLSWAVLTRNLQLVKILLAKYAEDRTGDIRRAFHHYYWEILEELLRSSPPEENLWDIYLFDFEKSPYGHWIIHGSDRFSSIDRTLDIVQRYNSMPIGKSLNATMNLILMIQNASTEEHFHHVEWLLNIMTPSQIKQFSQHYGSPLLAAVYGAKNNTTWIQILKAILIHYSVEELHIIPFHEKARSLGGASFLHLAVRLDCVAAARVLLEKGVDPNLRGTGTQGITPLHACLTCKGSVEMLDTLLEFGADVNMELLQSMSTPIITLLGSNRHENSLLLDRIIEYPHSEEVILTMLFNIISRHPAPETQAYAILLHLLTKPNVAQHVNAKFLEGYTLLLYSVSFYLLEITALLLEAGADPLIGVRFEDRDVYPLQIACARGRNNGDKFILSNTPRTNAQRSEECERSMRIAVLLLEAQSRMKSNPFHGIGELHIAAYMDIDSEIQRLLAEGKDPKAIGMWPQVSGGITPDRLIKTQMTYTKFHEIDRDPNPYRKVWRQQLCIFDRNMSSKSTIATYELFKRDYSATRYVFQSMQKWTSRFSKGTVRLKAK